PPATVKNTPLASLANALLIQRSDGGYTALLPLQPADAKPIDEATVSAALKGVPSARMLDIKGELDRLYDHYLGEAKAQALFGALGVVLLIAVTLRSLPRVLAVCQPLLLSVLLTLGLLAAFHVQLGILHLVGLLLVVAVGSNY